MTGALRRRFGPLALLLLAVVAAACSSGGTSSGGPGSRTLVISGIPDQNVATLNRIFGLTASYLSKATGLDVRYAPAADYSAIVTAFRRGDVQLAWFGGLTGVQAREMAPGAEAIVQRPRDAQFHSVFIAQSGIPIRDLSGLKGLTFTFGSESSTSGHLMPRYFMSQAGVDPDKNLKGAPSYSGSHDKTYKLVESGAFQTGALNEAVWESAVKEGKVDTSKVRVFYTTPSYYDYHWAVVGDIDKRIGPGTREKVTKALLDLRADSSPEAKELLSLFATDRFVPTEDKNYDSIRQVAEQLGILRQYVGR